MLITQPKKTSEKASILGFIFIMFIIGCILLFRTPSVQAVTVASQLQQFSDILNRDAAKVGRQASLSYGSVTLEGSGYDKYAAIHNLHFSLSAKVGATEGSWTLDTEKVTITLDPLNDKRLIFKFIEPITLTQDKYKKTLITMSTPLKFGYFDNGKPADQSVSLITLRLPSEVTLASLDTADAKLPPLVISYDDMPEISIRNDAVAKEHEAHSEVRNIIVQSGAEQNINMGALASNIDEKIWDNNKLSGKFAFTLSDLIRRVNGKAVATCSLASSITYNSSETLMGFFGIPEKAAVTANLNKMIFACEDFNIRLEGDFALTPGDALPSGVVTVTIDDTKALLASGMLSEQTRNELTTALPKITGQPLDKLTRISVPVRRAANGQLMLGTVSAQDAGITILNNLFTNK